MSHYTVLIIGDNIKKQLAPYSENLKVPEYKNNDGDLTTYNQLSKWDWYQVGGRWAGFIKLKDNPFTKMRYKEIYKIPNFSYGWNEEEKEKAIKDLRVDYAIKKDIDFSINKEEYNIAKRFWEIVVEDSIPSEEEKKQHFNMYKKEYYTKRYKDADDYATRQSQFSTYAVLKNGTWYEKGEMVWFGCSSDTAEDSKQWDDSYYDLFIKNLTEDTRLTIVDCHI